MTAQGLWSCFTGLCVVISIRLLLKYKIPSTNSVYLALGLSLFVSLSYLSNIKINPRYMLLNPIITFLGILAVLSVFQAYPNKRFPIIKWGKFQPLLSIFIGGLIGGVLGIINLLIAQQTMIFNFSIYCLFGSFSPAIMEEWIMRTLFYVLCLHLFNGKLETKVQQFTCLFMMVVPHVLVHTPAVFIQYGLITGVVNIIVYVMLYGLPFALLQKKWDMTSAMLAHGIVEFLRFCFIGLTL